MRPATITPTGIERTFGDDELIVSKTDSKGLIRYVNPTFLRMSAFTEAEVIGRPHNIVRHPGMPRVVFQLMWDRISSGQEIFAYVLNLAADGAHYWVHAHVTPTFGATLGSITGYHSDRRAPGRATIGPVSELYRRLCLEESRHARPGDAIAASTVLLHDVLAERGQTYDEWVWATTVPAVRR